MKTVRFGKSLAGFIEKLPEFQQALKDAGYCGAELNKATIKRIAKVLQKDKLYRGNIIEDADDAIETVVEWLDSEPDGLTKEGFERTWKALYSQFHAVATCLFMVGVINGFLAGIATGGTANDHRRRP
jgi:hypothetical protein